MFLTVFGQKEVWQNLHQSSSGLCGLSRACRCVLLMRIATARRHRLCRSGHVPFEVVPVQAAAKATRHAQVIIDGQASSHEDELKNLSAGADLVLLPTTPQARSVELTMGLLNPPPNGHHACRVVGEGG